MKVILKFSSLGEVFDVPMEQGSRLMVGRGNKPQMKISDEKMSSIHCTVFLEKHGMKVVDTESKNGTYLNGIRIKVAEVFLGDEIKMGDTVVTIDEKKMDQKIRDILTFPGPAKARMEYELKMDFTGARFQNQLYNRANPESHYANTQNQAREISIRKQARTQIMLSKDEIKHRYQVLSNVSKILDILIVIGIILVPILFVNNAIKGNGGISLIGFSATEVQEQKLNLICGLEILFAGTYFFVSMRVMKFSFGEKIVGIERIYNSQGE